MTGCARVTDNQPYAYNRLWHLLTSVLNVETQLLSAFAFLPCVLIIMLQISRRNSKKVNMSYSNRSVGAGAYFLFWGYLAFAGI